MMDITPIIRQLEHGNIRRVDGCFKDDDTEINYEFRAYTIENPIKQIRIDIKREEKK